MTDTQRVLLAALGGAIMGGMAGYFTLTDEGRRTWSRLEPVVDRVVGDLMRVTTSSTRDAGTGRPAEGRGAQGA